MVLVLALGCAKSAPATAPESTPPPPSVAEVEPVPAPEPAPASEDACSDGESCEQLASTVAEEDPARAVELWVKACEFGALGACFNAAEQVREDDSAKAVGLYGKACSAEANDAMLLSLACSRGALTAYGTRDFEAARTMAVAICDDAMAAGCGLLGVLYAQGLGVTADVDAAKAYLDKGCKGGDEEACENLGKLDAAIEHEHVASVLPVEGANVSIGAITVDGLSATDLECRRDGGGGLFGGAMGAISGISKRRGKLMKCASEPEDVRVRWTATGGKIATVEVQASTPKVGACVKKSIRGASAAFGGTCAATFSIGG